MAISEGKQNRRNQLVNRMSTQITNKLDQFSNTCQIPTCVTQNKLSQSYLCSDEIALTAFFVVVIWPPNEDKDFKTLTLKCVVLKWAFLIATVSEPYVSCRGSTRGRWWVPTETDEGTCLGVVLKLNSAKQKHTAKTHKAKQNTANTLPASRRPERCLGRLKN